MKTLAFIIFISTLIQTVHSTNRPTIGDEILPEVKQLGETAYLNCTVNEPSSSSSASSVVQWLKQSTPSKLPLLISEGESVRIDTVIDGKRKYDVVKIRRGSTKWQYQLIIRALTDLDAGNYTCQVYLENVNYLQWPKKLGLLTVQTPPTIRDTSRAETQAEEGENVTLKCEADGIPPPNITWTRGDGSSLSNGAFSHRGGRFVISNITARDRGQYLCIADNNVKPPDKYVVQLEVRFRPICIAMQDTVGQAQNMKYNAKLECIVQANPPAEVTWYRRSSVGNDRETLSDTDKYKIELSDDQRLKADEKWYILTILNIQGNDYNLYYCVASNVFGENEATFTLFETMECQGQNCPSVGAGKGPPMCQISILTFILSLVITSVCKHFL